MANDNAYQNHKPYRTKAQKAEAKRTAKQGKDGVWRSNAPVSYHKPLKQVETGE